MRIIVTGSSGTIGTRLCETLLAEGHDVHGLDWVPNKWNADIQRITTEMDLRNWGQIDAARSGLQADLLIHLAANARVYELVEHPDRARDNILTTFNALELARQNAIPRFLFASSREVYGNVHAEVYAEDMADIDECESPYTASKMAGEALVQSYRRCYNLETIITRFSNVYGMYDDSNRVIPLFIRQAQSNEPMTVFGKDKYLDFTYIDDTVHGIMLCVEKFDTVKNCIYNIAFGQGNSIVRLAETVKEQLHSSSPIAISIMRTGEITRYVADITKARRVLGYNPRTPFDEGVKKTIQWYSEHLSHDRSLAGPKAG